MESEQYIKSTRWRDTDQWSVFFINKNGLSVDEVDNIISKFVTKKKINQTSNPNGMCFINFFSSEDAVNCVEGLRGHELIQLKKQFKDRGELKKNEFKYDEMYKSDFKNDKMYKSDSKDNEMKYNEKDSFTNNSTDITRKSPEAFNELITELKVKNVIDTNTYNYLNQEFQENQCVADIEPKMPELVLKKNASNIIVSKDTIAENLVEEKLKSIEKVEAEELIIANIHEDYGTNYILHLLEKYQPICASLVKISERYGLRYCHVYFTSNQHINEVQKKFDQFELGTKNLIVLYVNRLQDILSS